MTLGSVTTAPAAIAQATAIANSYQPAYATNPAGPAGSVITVPQSNPMPSGVRWSVSGAYLSVNLSNGELKFNVPTNANDGDFWTRTITVTYPDRTTDTVSVRFYAQGSALGPTQIF